MHSESEFERDEPVWYPSTHTQLLACQTEGPALSLKEPHMCASPLGYDLWVTVSAAHIVGAQAYLPRLSPEQAGELLR
jgi:hypothetical protein